MFSRCHWHWGLFALGLIVVPPRLSAPVAVAAVEVVPASAAKISPPAALERFFTAEQLSADWFTQQFLDAVPLPKIQAIITQLKQLGAFGSVQPDGDGWVVRLSRGDVPAQISVNATGKVAGLQFGPPIQRVATLEAAIAQFRQLPGKVSVVVQEGQTVRASLNPKQPLGVGSAFKLAVLDALQAKIAAKQLTWQTVVPLQAKFKSLPSGRLQNWPNGSWLTIQTLAAMMISESDNTATDHLIQLIGRENIAENGSRNLPLLMTREFFQLKSSSNADLLRRYRQADREQKKQVLAALAQRPLPQVAEFAGETPLALDVEWFYTPIELCQLINRVAKLPLMGINPGLAKPQDWAQIAYKGGSEVGVLNFTTHVRSPMGKCYCVSATWNNDQPLDQTKFASLYSGLLLQLQQTAP